MAAKYTNTKSEFLNANILSLGVSQCMSWPLLFWTLPSLTLSYAFCVFVISQFYKYHVASLTLFHPFNFFPVILHTHTRTGTSDFSFLFQSPLPLSYSFPTSSCYCCTYFLDLCFYILCEPECDIVGYNNVNGTINKMLSYPAFSWSVPVNSMCFFVLVTLINGHSCRIFVNDVCVSRKRFLP